MSVRDLRGLRLVPGTTAKGEAFLDEWLRLRGSLPAPSVSANVELAGFLRAMTDAAARLTARDVELIRAIDDAGTIYAAARKVAPGNPESMEVRMRSLTSKFREVALFFFRNAQIPGPQTLGTLPERQGLTSAEVTP